MAYTVLPATDGVTLYGATRDQYFQDGISRAHLSLDRLVYDAQNAGTGTVDPTGVADSRAGLQNRMNTAAALNYPVFYIGPGTYKIDSATDGTNAYGLVVPPGLSIIGAGSNRTTFVIGATNLNLFWIGSTLSATAIATITSDWALRDKTFTCSGGMNGIVTGDVVATRIGQNVSDSAESKQTVLAKVTAASGTSITIDTPASWAGVVASTSAVNRKFTKVTAVAERQSIGGFHVVGNTNLRHAVGIQTGRYFRVFDVTGIDVGSGAINAQWVDGLSVRDVYVYSCQAFTNVNKGRAVSFSNVTNAVVENLNTDYLEAASLYCESYCKNIRVTGFRIQNRLIARIQQYMIFSGICCSVDISNLQVDAWNTAAVGYDSVVSFGSATGTDRGQVHLHNTEIYMPLAEIRALPLFACSGYFRCFDASGNLQTFNLNRIERSTVAITLTDNATKTAWLRDGLWVAIDAAVPAGVTGAGLTALNATRTSGSSVAIPWVANRNIRMDGWIGNVIYPAQSNWDKATKINATVANGAGLTGTIIYITVYSVVPVEYSTVLDEPGTAQIGRFSNTYAV
jgi:hypothetical protein